MKVSTRTLQRYTTQGKISVTYKHGKTGAEADYDREELERFKKQKDSAVYQPAVHLAPPNEGQSQALAPMARESRALEAFFERLQPPRPSVPVETKPLLKLNEASLLTGLSRQILRTAIETKKLKAKIVGKAWRIKREELDQFIKGM